MDGPCPSPLHWGVERWPQWRLVKRVYHEISNLGQGILDMICGTPLGFNHMADRYPSVRYATLGSGVQRRWRKSQMFESVDRANRRAHLHPPFRSRMNCKAVPLQSPVSRSAHWVELGNKQRTPTGFHIESHYRTKVTSPYRANATSHNS